MLGRDLGLRSRPGLVEAGTGWPWLRHGGSVEEQREVATRKWRRDLVCFGWAETVSRHGFDVATWAAVWEVATWNFGVATWKTHVGRNVCRDMKLMSRHKVASRRVAT